MKKRYVLNASDRSRTSTITSRSQLDKVTHVYDNLDTTHQKMLKASCFKQFVGLKSLNLSSQIVHHLLMRISEKTNGEDFWFIIDKKPIRFSILEFVLVSGLKVGHDTFIKHSEETPRLVTKYLKKPPLKRKDVLVAFDNCKVDQADKYKLGLIVILCHVLIGSEDNANVTLWWFELVDDLEKFNEHPWGKASYELTSDLLRRNMQSTFTRKNAYSLHGFPLCIMVWALEAIPTLARLAEKFDEVNVPRLSNWKVDKNIKSVDIDKVLEGEHVDCHEKLQPTDVERHQPYWVALEHYLDGVGFSQPADTNFGVGSSQPADTNEIVPLLDYDLLKDIFRSVVEENNKKVYSALEKIEAKVDRVESKVVKLFKSFRGSASRGVQANMDDVNVEQPDYETCTMDNDKLDDSSVTKVVEVKESCAKSTKRKAERVASAVFEQPFLDPIRRRKLEGVIKYDPFRELDPAKCDFLNTLLVKFTNDSSFTINLGDGNLVCSKVLSGILTSEWLPANIMNASLKLIRERMECYPNLFQQDACVIDSYFLKFVRDEYVILKKIDLKMYDGLGGWLTNWANGVFHKEWKACRYLYAPVCEKLHWFVIKIDLEEQCIFVFDSLPTHITEAELQGFMLPIQKVVPLVLKLVDNRELGELTVVKVYGVPVQRNGYDCGIFALKFIEFLIGRQDVRSIQDGDFCKWREKLVAELVAQHFEP